MRCDVGGGVGGPHVNKSLEKSKQLRLSEHRSSLTSRASIQSWPPRYPRSCTNAGGRSLRLGKHPPTSLSAHDGLWYFRTRKDAADRMRPSTDQWEPGTLARRITEASGKGAAEIRTRPSRRDLRQGCRTRRPPFSVLPRLFPALRLRVSAVGARQNR